MRKRINQNLVWIAILAMFLTLALSTVVFINLMKQQISEDLKSQVHQLVHSEKLLTDVEKNYKNGNDVIRITVVNPDGTVVYDSEADPKKMQNHNNRPEIKSAEATGTGQDVRESNTVGKLTYYYAERMDSGQIVRAAREFGGAFSFVAYLFPELILIIVVILAVCLLLGHFLTKKFMQPIELLASETDNAQWMKTYPELQPFIKTISEQHAAIKRNANMRQEFTANVSHELKTPLTSISGYAELIEAGIASGEDITRFAGEIHKNAQRLLVLINDILRLSQLDTVEDKLEKEDVDLFEMAVACKEMLKIQAQKNQVSVTVQGQREVVNANRQMIDEMIYNLCDNAIRYNVVGGKVLVTVGKSGQNIFISVKDSGIGIPKKHQDRIFERFYRVDKSRSKQTGGTGLGLAIVKHIAVLHNADIIVESEQGKGTEIRIEFSPDSL